MIWALASIPFWFVGFGLFFVGFFGVIKVAFTEGRAFKSGTDEEVLKMGFMMIIGSGVFLILAAKIAS